MSTEDAIQRIEQIHKELQEIKQHYPQTQKMINGICMRLNMQLKKWFRQRPAEKLKDAFSSQRKK